MPAITGRRLSDRRRYSILSDHALFDYQSPARFKNPIKKPALAGFFNLAEWTGLEPATPGVTGRYSNRLNYHSSLHIVLLAGVGQSRQGLRTSVDIL
jgi:hypothetical protein